MDIQTLTEEKTRRLSVTDYRRRPASVLKRLPVIIAAEPGYTDTARLAGALAANGITPAAYCADTYAAPGTDALSFEETRARFGRDVNIIVASGCITDALAYTGIGGRLAANSLYNQYSAELVMRVFEGYEPEISDAAAKAAEEASFLTSENAGRIKHILSVFDERSRHIYLSLLAVRCSAELSGRACAYLPVYEPGQYFPSGGFFRIADNEVFVDGGAFNGDSVLDFAEYTGGRYNQITAFEPDEANYTALRENTRHPPNIILHKKGLYSAAGAQEFIASSMSSRIIDAPVLNETVKIQTVRGDDCLDAPTYIKFDVEGAESEALIGMDNTITRRRPKLAVCLYHKPADIFDIPYYIAKLYPDYRLCVRHHRPTAGETVLYAAV